LSNEAFNQWSKPQLKYERHRPEASLLYQLIKQHWPQFQVEMRCHSKHLPKFVTQEFEASWIQTPSASKFKRSLRAA
jgi:hypothetical protein